MRVPLTIVVHQAKNNEHEDDETLSLPGGSVVGSNDPKGDSPPALQRFLGRCSQRTIYLRFFGSLNEFTEEKAQYFAHADGVDHFAFVAIDPDDRDEIIAVVRYDREPGQERAEYAAIVEEAGKVTG